MTTRIITEPHERVAIDELRELLHRAPHRLPVDIDTDFNLLRWLRGYHGNTTRLVEAFDSYVESRHAAGFDCDNMIDGGYFDLPHIAPYLQYMASSRLGDRLWSEKHKAFVFVEKAWAQPKEFVKTLKTSDYLLHCFGYSEYLLQLVLRRERQLGHSVQFIVIFDLGSISISDYINPTSACMKLWKLRSDLWQQWYPEMVQKIVLVNPPRFLGALWSIVRLFLDEHNCKLIEVANSHADIRKHLDPALIPVAYGGQYVDSANATSLVDDACTTRRKTITNDDHYRSYRHYTERSLTKPKSTHISVPPNTTITVPIQLTGDQTNLLWDFTTNAEIDFCIYRCASADSNDNCNQHKMIYPKLRLVTSKLPEEGIIENLPIGSSYELYFHNPSNYFQAKIDYAYAVI